MNTRGPRDYSVFDPDEDDPEGVLLGDGFREPQPQAVLSHHPWTIIRWVLIVLGVLILVLPALGVQLPGVTGPVFWVAAIGIVVLLWTFVPRGTQARHDDDGAQL